ncbi:MAG: hypothetical protein ACYTEQ_01660 [Planctomycetota bacterium]|jgi:hypothetical protein
MGVIRIKIETGNAAFDLDAEYKLSRILRELNIGKVISEGSQALRDINGNKVGEATYHQY